MYVVLLKRPETKKWQIVAEEYIPEVALELAGSYSEDNHIRVKKTTGPVQNNEHQRAWQSACRALWDQRYFVAKSKLQFLLGIDEKRKAKRYIPIPPRPLPAPIKRLVEQYNDLVEAR